MGDFNIGQDQLQVRTASQSGSRQLPGSRLSQDDPDSDVLELICGLHDGFIAPSPNHLSLSQGRIIHAPTRDGSNTYCGNKNEIRITRILIFNFFQPLDKFRSHL